MPYITQNERSDFIDQVDALYNCLNSVGSINYVITRLIHNWLIDRKFCYKGINEMIGVLECAKMELYRQVAAKYEDKKKLENGGVSKLDSKTLEDVR